MLQVSRWQVLVAGRWFPVSFPGGIPAVPLLSEAERIHAVGPIDGKHTVKVVDLMLEQFRSIGFQVDLLGVAFQILKSNPDAIGPLDPDHQVRKGEAVVPNREIFGSDVDNLWVDEGPRSIHLDVDDPDWGSDLGRCNRPPGPES